MFNPDNKGRIFAKEWHKEVNQSYGHELPYHFHTDLVGTIASKYISLVPEKSRGVVINAAHLHDTIEDCRKTYNDVQKEFGREVADLVYALTNEKGKTRGERANAKYYNGINNIKYGVFIKLCDRIANVLYGVVFGGGMVDVYRKENDHFLASLNTDGYEDMVYDLKVLLTTGIFNFTAIDKIHEVS